MASLVSSVEISGASGSLPTHAAGDIIVVFAYRDGSTTAPSLPSDWTAIANSGANTNSARVGYKVAASSSETSGTWTSASRLVVHVWRADTGYAIGVGNFAAGGASSTTISYTGFTLANGNGRSRLSLFVGHRSTNTTLSNAPSGATNQTNGVDGTCETASFIDTAGGVSSWTTQTASVGGTSSGWRSYVVEITEVVSLPQTTGPWTLVQRAGEGAGSGSGSSTTYTAAFGSNITAGNWCAVYVSWGDTGTTSPAIYPSSVADNLGNTYTLVSGTDSVLDPSNQAAAYYAGEILTGGAATITVTWPSSVPWRVIVATELNLDSASGTIAVDGGSGTATGSTTTPGTGNITATTTEGLLLGYCAEETGASVVITETDGTAYYQPSSNNASYRRITSAGTVSANWSVTSASVFLATGVLFKAVSAGTTIPTFTGLATATGFAPTVAATANVQIATALGQPVVTGFAPTVVTPVAVATALGQPVVTGFAPLVVTPNAVATGFGQPVVTGFAPTVIANASVAVATGLGQSTISGFAPTVVANNNVVVQSALGQPVVTGLAPSAVTSNNQLILAGLGQPILTGTAPTVVISNNQSISTSLGQPTLIGYVPVVVATTGTAKAVAGALTMSGALATKVLTPRAVSGTLTTAGTVTFASTYAKALAGALQMNGVLGTVLRVTQSIAGTLTGAGAVTSTYFPPSAGDFLTLLRRRNQTD